MITRGMTRFTRVALQMNGDVLVHNQDDTQDDACLRTVFRRQGLRVPSFLSNEHATRQTSLQSPSEA